MNTCYSFIKDISSGVIVGAVAWNDKTVASRWFDQQYSDQLTFSLKAHGGDLSTLVTTINGRCRCMVSMALISVDGDPDNTIERLFVYN